MSAESKVGLSFTQNRQDRLHIGLEWLHEPSMAYANPYDSQNA